MFSQQLDLVERAVEILTLKNGSNHKYGSAFLIGGHLVLTCAHLFDLKNGEKVCKIKSDLFDEGEVTAKLVWHSIVSNSDIALVELPENIEGYTPVKFGKLPTFFVKDGFKFMFLGWPKWGKTGNKPGRRECNGKIFSGDSSPDNLIVLELHRNPGERESGIAEENTPFSGWAGASGAAVISQDLVIGVQRWHQNPNRASSLEADPIAHVCEEDGWRYYLQANGINPDLQELAVPINTATKPKVNQAGERVKNFVGRTRELSEVHNSLASSPTIAISASIAGMGGIGKTALARQYAIEYNNNYPGGVVWLDAREGDVSTQILRLVDLPDEWKKKSPEEQVQRCWHDWKPPTGNVLLVIDNVDAEDTYKALLPLKPKGDRFKVLITTRIRRIDSNIEDISLDVLDLSDAKILLKSLIGDERVQDEQSIEELCQWLGCLPLGLRLVGSYLGGNPLESVSDTLEALKSESLDDLSVEERGGNISIEKSFNWTWKKLDASTQKVGLVLSVFAQAKIPREYVRNICNLTGIKNRDIRLASSQLFGYHLIQKESIGLSRDFLLEINPSSVNLIDKGISGDVCCIDDKSLVVERDQGIRLMSPEEIQMHDYFSNHEFKQDEIPALKILIGSYHEYGVLRRVQAEKLLRRVKDKRRQKKNLQEMRNCKEIIEARIFLALAHGIGSNIENKDFSEIDHSRAYYWKQLAEIALITGNLDDAEKLYKEVWKHCEDKKGFYFSVHAPHLGLQKVYMRKEKFKEAESITRELLEFQKTAYGEEHRYIAKTKNKLAEICRNQRTKEKNEEAEKLLQEVIDLQVCLVGKNHPDYAHSLKDLAWLYQYAFKKYDKAIPLYEQALEIFEHNQEEDSVEWCNNKLAKCSELMKQASSRNVLKRPNNRYQRNPSKPRKPKRKS